MYPTVQEQLQCLLLQPLQHVKLTYTYKTYNTEIHNASNSLQTTTWRQSSASVSTTQISRCTKALI